MTDARKSKSNMSTPQWGGHNSIGQRVFELESGNGNFDGQTNGQTNGRNYTNFERNLAMMVIYVPVKFEIDWTNCFRVRVRKQKCGRTDGRTNEQMELHQFRKEPSYYGDLWPR